MQRKKADRTRVGKNSYLLTAMVVKNFAELGCYAAEQVPIAFAFSDHVMNVTVHEGVIIAWKGQL